MTLAGPMPITEAKLRLLVHLFKHSRTSTDGLPAYDAFAASEVPSPPFTPIMIAEGLHRDGHVRLADDKMTLTADGYELCELLSSVPAGIVAQLATLMQKPAMAIAINHPPRHITDALVSRGALCALSSGAFTASYSTPAFIVAMKLLGST